MSRTKQAEISRLILDYVKQHGSVTFIDLQSLLDEGTLRLIYSSELEYLKAGVIVTLPVAGKRPPRKGYKKRRWMPLALEINDKKEKKG